MSSLRKKIISGTIWSGGGQLIEAGLRFGIMLILARLLSPDFFGLLGLSIVVMLILRNISDLGLGSALIQQKQIDTTDIASVFWANLALSILMSAVLFISAPTVGIFLGDVRLTSILRLLAILLPVNASTIVIQAILQRNLQFAQLAWRDIAGMVGFGLIGIPLAMLNMGYWSLIGALAAQWISRSLVLWLTTPYSPPALFSLARLRALLNFGAWMFIGTMTWQLMNNIDYFVIGRSLGSTDLGYYTLAFQLVVIPIQRVTGILAKVLFPTFAMIQDNPLQLKTSFLQAIRVLLLVLFPISAFIFTIADYLVPLLYSSKWLPAVPIVRLLACASFFYGLDIMNSILNAIGKPHWQFIILGLRATIFIFLAWIWGLKNGIEGVALCILYAVALSTIVQVWILLHVLQIKLLIFIRSTYIPIIAIFPPMLLTLWLKSHLMATQSYGIQLVIIGPAFATLYALLVLPSYYHELREIIITEKI